MDDNNYYETYNEEDEIISIGFFASVIALLSIILPIFIIGIFCINSYNKVIHIEENVNLAKAQVEVQMQRHLELIPDLIEVTKVDGENKKNIISDIINASDVLNECLKKGDSTKINEANNQLSSMIYEYLNVIECNYPNIALNKEYISLMKQFECSADKIAIAKENYNEAVNIYNKKIRSFPEILFARMLSFEEIEIFKIDENANNF